ncbi:MAG: sigma-70 family RNA polymerase sigma factor [Acidobacteriia bacterium]|nr:sigma-70 family RNA polymerase sigma factor [Terriglobia bacterium]
MSSEMAVEKIGEARRWTSPGDGQLVEQLRTGSQAAYVRLVEQFEHSIYNLLYRLLGNPHDAADVTQEVFIKIYRGIGRFNGDSNLRTWIYRIAIREAANWHRWWLRRRYNRTVSLDLVDPDDGQTVVFENVLKDHALTPSERVMRLELEARLQAALRSLPLKYRMAVLLRDVEEFSYEEIASTLHISVGTVKSRILRGRELLRDKVRALLDTDPRV